MKVFESRGARALLVRLERGEDVLGALATLAAKEKIGAAWVRGIGSLASAKVRRQIEGPLEVMSFEGTLTFADGEADARLRVSLASDSGQGARGRLEGGEALNLELRIEVFEELRAEKPASRAWTAPREPERREPQRRELEDDDDLGEDDDLEDEPLAARAAPAAPSGAVSWADVAAASVEAEAEPEFVPAPRRPKKKKKTPGFKPPPLPKKQSAAEEPVDDDYFPAKGDFIRHRQFGLCRVDREDANGGVVIRLPSGIKKTLRLDFMDVGAPRMEGHKRVFAVRPRKR